MWKKFLIHCKEFCLGMCLPCLLKIWQLIRKKEMRGLGYVLVFLSFLSLFFFVAQLAIPQEGFTLTSTEMSELENLLESLKKENRQLMTKSEGLRSLAQRLREALERRTESLDSLRSSYDEFEKDAKTAMNEMSFEIAKQKERIKRIKRMMLTIVIMLLLSLLMNVALGSRFFRLA